MNKQVSKNGGRVTCRYRSHGCAWIATLFGEKLTVDLDLKRSPAWACSGYVRGGFTTPAVAMTDMVLESSARKLVAEYRRSEPHPVQYSHDKVINWGSGRIKVG